MEGKLDFGETIVSITAGVMIGTAARAIILRPFFHHLFDHVRAMCEKDGSVSVPVAEKRAWAAVRGRMVPGIAVVAVMISALYLYGLHEVAIVASVVFVFEGGTVLLRAPLAAEHDASYGTENED